MDKRKSISDTPTVWKNADGSICTAEDLLTALHTYGRKLQRGYEEDARRRREWYGDNPLGLPDQPIQ